MPARGTARPVLAVHAFTLAFALALALGSPASAQEWTPVAAVPTTAEIFDVWAKRDTIAASSDSVVFLSVDGGDHWVTTTKVAPGVTAVRAVRVHNGRVYAGTFGQGVFVSTNFGASWQAFNQGLTGGIFDTHLFLKDLLIRGDSLYAATSGAGAYVRSLAAAPGAWTHHGEVFEPNSASTMSGLAVSPTRLVAAAGANGTVFFRDPGQPDWTLSWLNNLGPAAGLSALCARWTGSSWLVGSNIGVFRSATGQSPWTFVDVGPGPIFTMSFAQRGPVVFLHVGAGSGTVILYSVDDGAFWHPLEELLFTFTHKVALVGDDLYAARFDGLWRRSVATVSAPGSGGPPGPRLAFTLAGAHPFRDEARVRFTLPEGGRVRIELFDVAGRRVAGGIDEVRAAGPHEVRLATRNIEPGVYLARLDAVGRSEVLRFVRIR